MVLICSREAVWQGGTPFTRCLGMHALPVASNRIYAFLHVRKTELGVVCC